VAVARRGIAGQTDDNEHGLIQRLGVITSWSVADCRQIRDPVTDERKWLYPGIESLAQRGICCFEYYFLSPAELPMLASILGRAFDTCSSVVDLALALCPNPEQVDLEQVDRSRLRRLVDILHANPEIGPFGAVHFRSVATNIPGLASADETVRDKAARGLMVALHVAEMLDAGSVELVCGAPTRRTGTIPSVALLRPDPVDEDSDGVRQHATTQVVRSLLEVGEVAQRLDKVLALEIEPGLCFVNNSVSRCMRIIDEVVERKPQLSPHLGVNCDVGHMLLLGEQPGWVGDEVRHLAQQLHEWPHLDADARRFAERTVAFHLSDHASSHHSDLPPGSYHGQQEFRPWVEFYRGLCNSKRREDLGERALRVHPGFQGVASLEMEACEDPERVAGAYSTFRDWLFPYPSEGYITGCVMIVDIVGSTRALFRDASKEDKAVLALQLVISSMIEGIEKHGGQVMQFTGDGIVAAFEDARHNRYPSERARAEADVAQNALSAVFDLASNAGAVARRAFSSVESPYEATPAGGADQGSIDRFRFSIHRGRFYSTTLRFAQDLQLAGRVVVEAARMVEWLRDESRRLMEGNEEQFTMCLASTDFVNKLAAPQRTQLRSPGPPVHVPIRGLADHQIECWQFAAHDYVLTPDSAGRSFYIYSGSEPEAPGTLSPEDVTAPNPEGQG
jgi:class 3 adenylate cyclase